MSKPTRLVLFMFAGRRENMEVQMPYLRRILDTYPQAELHLWDLTRLPSDQRYIYSLHDGERIKVIHDLHPGHPIKCLYPTTTRRPRGWRRCECLRHKPPYEQPYRMYAADKSSDTVYVKIDDDVMFLETNRFADLIAPLAEHPNRIISASVVNNSVCAKYLDELTVARVANFFRVGDATQPANDKRWWELHTLPEFATYMHDWFINYYKGGSGAIPGQMAEALNPRPTYVRTRPGEAVSINCIAFTQATMNRLAKSFEHEPRLGDEGAVDRMLPWICTSFMAAHLTFGPQDAAMTPDDLDIIRKRYTQLSEAYL